MAEPARILGIVCGNFCENVEFLPSDALSP